MNNNGWHSFQAFLLITVLFCMLGPVGAQSPGSPPPEVLAYADLVFYNGKILTADEQFTIVQAVAIRDGKFLAVEMTGGYWPWQVPKPGEWTWRVAA